MMAKWMIGESGVLFKQLRCLHSTCVPVMAIGRSLVLECQLYIYISNNHRAR